MRPCEDSEVRPKRIVARGGGEDRSRCSGVLFVLQRGVLSEVAATPTESGLDGGLLIVQGQARAKGLLTSQRHLKREAVNYGAPSRGRRLL